MTNIKSEEIPRHDAECRRHRLQVARADGAVAANGTCVCAPATAVGGIWAKYQPPAPEVTLTPGGPDAPASSTVTVLNAEDIKRAAKRAEHDPVKEPAHYKSEGGLEVIDIIELFELGFRLGNVVKYILRAPKKGATLQDLKKARQYLSREIAALEGRRGWE